MRIVTIGALLFLPSVIVVALCRQQDFKTESELCITVMGAFFALLLFFASGDAFDLWEWIIWKRDCRKARREGREQPKYVV